MAEPVNLQALLNKYQITPAREAVDGKFSFIVAGPAGTGKSTLLGSMAAVGNSLLLATLPREISSWKYQQYNIASMDVWDEGWYATDNNGSLPRGLKITGYDKFMEITEALKDDDEYDCIILDNGTELGELAWHKAMLPYGVIAPAFMEDKRSRWLPYDTLGTNLDQAIKNLVSLTNSATAKRPKFVGISWHVQPPKDDQAESVEVGGGQKAMVKKASADNKAEGVEYEGKVLPMIRGGFRRKLTSQVDAVVYTDLRYETITEGTRVKRVPKYVIQVQPDEERHAKIPGPMSATATIPNDFTALLKLVEAGKVAEAKEAKPEQQKEAGRPSLRTNNPK